MVVLSADCPMFFAAGYNLGGASACSRNLKKLPSGWPDENTNPTRKRGLETFPRLRVGLVETPLVQLLAAFLSGHPRGDAANVETFNVWKFLK